MAKPWHHALDHLPDGEDSIPGLFCFPLAHAVVTDVIVPSAANNYIDVGPGITNGYGGAIDPFDDLFTLGPCSSVPGTPHGVTALDYGTYIWWTIASITDTVAPSGAGVLSIDNFISGGDYLMDSSEVAATNNGSAYHWKASIIGLLNHDPANGFVPQLSPRVHNLTGADRHVAVQAGIMRVSTKTSAAFL